MDGILNILKPPGLTSHGVVAHVRRLLGQKRIGHTGTLDPAAAGVLPLCLGEATKVVPYLTELTKTYRAELTLGITTDTLDATGNPRAVNEGFAIARSTLVSALQRYVGESWQIPPMVSAVKVGGRRLYELARQGIEVERAARRIYIEKIEVIKMWPEDVDKLTLGARVMIDVTCSKGTYIRTLCADIGDDLGCGAHLSFLVRTQSGPFRLSDALTLEEVAAASQEGRLSEMVCSIEAALNDMAWVWVDAEGERAMGHGAPVRLPARAIRQSASIQVGETVRVHGPLGRILGLAEVAGPSQSTPQWLRPKRLFVNRGQGEAT